MRLYRVTSPLFDAGQPVIPLASATSTTLQSTLMDSCGQGVGLCNMTKPDRCCFTVASRGSLCPMSVAAMLLTRSLIFMFSVGIQSSLLRHLFCVVNSLLRHLFSDACILLSILRSRVHIVDGCYKGLVVIVKLMLRLCQTLCSLIIVAVDVATLMWISVEELLTALSHTPFLQISACRRP